MPTRSSEMRSLTRDSVAGRRSAHRLRELDLGQALVGVVLLAGHRPGHAHVGVHELDRRAHLLVVHPTDAVLRVALGLHQLESHHHVRLELMKTERYAKNGIGWMDDKKMCASVELVNTYMGVPKPVDCKEVYTNEFLTKVELPKSMR